MVAMCYVIRNLMSGVFGENDANLTPAHQLKDDKDYAPTPLGVAFSRHFASIARQVRLSVRPTVVKPRLKTLLVYSLQFV